MSFQSLSAQIKSEARRLGFDLVGITPAVLPEKGRFLSRWLKEGHQGEMQWMDRTADKRLDPDRVLPGVRSLVCTGMNYKVRADPPEDPECGKISRYAWGDDYHDVVLERLRRLEAFIVQRAPEAGTRAYVDTGPVLEKIWAERAGLGWIGKHTNLISRDLGSWFFLGEILTTLELEYDPPAEDYCGTCRRCIDACPTEAIVDEYVLDARKCISYLTIELKGDIPEVFHAPQGNWIYGCDICQEVCPWNRFSFPTREAAFQPRPGNETPRLAQWMSMTVEEFRHRFRRSPMKRARYAGLLRNVRIALRNLGLSTRQFSPGKPVDHNQLEVPSLVNRHSSTE